MGAATDRLRSNNLDLLRLIAALQVVLLHAVESFGIEVWAPVDFVLDAFPGVPVFFFLSGLLIYRSYENAGGMGQFAWNRFLRLFPGLWLCVMAAWVSVVLSGYPLEGVTGAETAVWLAAQGTIVQFYNPEWLRAYGVGVLNGSLWTISVEVQFYLLTPLLWWLVRRTSTRMLQAVALAFAAANLAYLLIPREFWESIIVRLLAVTFVPWFYMFVLGAIVATRPGVIDAIIARPLWQWVLLYLALAGASRAIGLPLGNRMNPVLVVTLLPIVVHAGFAHAGIADRLLRHQDVSYGTYIYHMPVINYLLFRGMGGAAAVLVTIAVTVLCAAVSWFALERPALRLKRRSLRTV